LISFKQTREICDEILKKNKSITPIFVNSEKEAKSAFKEIIKKTDLVLSGTSPDGIKDKWYWAIAKKLNKKVYAFVDQSSHFDERFPNLKTCEYPNKILLNSLDIPKKKYLNLYPSIKKIEIGNPVLLSLLKNKSKNKKNIINKRYIFCTEPSINQNMYKKINGFNDSDSFKLFLKFLRKNNIKSGIYIRLHPRDNDKRWLKILPTDIDIKFDTMKKIISLEKSSIVFGMRSHILLEAKIIGIKAISLQPNKKTKNFIENYIRVVQTENEFDSIFQPQPKIKLSTIECSHSKLVSLF
jgi:hypothetical protein